MATRVRHAKAGRTGGGPRRHRAVPGPHPGRAAFSEQAPLFRSWQAFDRDRGHRRAGVVKVSQRTKLAALDGTRGRLPRRRVPLLDLDNLETAPVRTAQHEQLAGSKRLNGPRELEMRSAGIAHRRSESHPLPRKHSELVRARVVCGLIVFGPGLGVGYCLLNSRRPGCTACAKPEDPHQNHASADPASQIRCLRCRILPVTHLPVDGSPQTHLAIAPTRHSSTHC